MPRRIRGVFFDILFLKRRHAMKKNTVLFLLSVFCLTAGALPPPQTLGKKLYCYETRWEERNKPRSLRIDLTEDGKKINILGKDLFKKLDARIRGVQLDLSSSDCHRKATFPGLEAFLFSCLSEEGSQPVFIGEDSKPIEAAFPEFSVFFETNIINAVAAKYLRYTLRLNASGAAYQDQDEFVLAPPGMNQCRVEASEKENLEE